MERRRRGQTGRSGRRHCSSRATQPSVTLESQPACLGLLHYCSQRAAAHSPHEARNVGILRGQQQVEGQQAAHSQRGPGLDLRGGSRLGAEAVAQMASSADVAA